MIPPRHTKPADEARIQTRDFSVIGQTLHCCTTRGANGFVNVIFGKVVCNEAVAYDVHDAATAMLHGRYGVPRRIIAERCLFRVSSNCIAVGQRKLR